MADAWRLPRTAATSARSRRRRGSAAIAGDAYPARSGVRRRGVGRDEQTPEHLAEEPAGTQIGWWLLLARMHL